MELTELMSKLGSTEMMNSMNSCVPDIRLYQSKESLALNSECAF